MLKDIIKLLRPQQWIKNSFVFLPLFCDRHLFELEYIVPTLIVFVAFCAIASSIYCMNDICDAETDRNHVLKRHRPLASGRISEHTAYIVMFLCAAISFLSISLGNFSLGGNRLILYGIILSYFIINVAYSSGLKNKSVIDLFIIALGFVLRVLAGGYSTGIWLSQWILLMSFLLALFFALAKRRDDVVLYNETGIKARKNVDYYNIPFLNTAISIVASITLVCYMMYTLSHEVKERFGNQHLYFTSIFVLAAMLRYIQITIVDEKSGSPTIILYKDHFIQACIIGWLLSFGIIIYL